MVQALNKTAWQSLKKLQLPHDSAVPFLGINPKEVKTGSQKNTCTPAFTVALVTIAETIQAAIRKMGKENMSMQYNVIHP